MIIEFENSLEDYSKSSLEFLKKYFVNSLLASALVSFIITSFIDSSKDVKFEWFDNFLIFLGLTLVITAFYNLKSVYNGYKISKLVKKTPAFLGKKRIVIEADGLIYGIQSIKYEWSLIKKIDDLPNYIYLILHSNFSIIINKKGLQNSEINDFIKEVSGHIVYKKSFFEKITSKRLYKFGFIGLIPNFGLISGTVLIVQGFIRKDNKMKMIGVGGILFTPLFWYVFLNSDFQKDNLTQFTNLQLNEVVKDLEFYKSKNGQYPDSLGQLKLQNKFFNDQELFSNDFDFKKSKSARFYYKKVESDYILKSFGPDLILNTKDDIYPELKIEK